MSEIVCQLPVKSRKRRCSSLVISFWDPRSKPQSFPAHASGFTEAKASLVLLQVSFHLSGRIIVMLSSAFLLLLDSLLLLFAYPTKRGELDLPFVTVALDLTGTTPDQS